MEISSQPREPGLRASLRNLIRLNLLSWKLFPLPPRLKDLDFSNLEESAKNVLDNHSHFVIIGRLLMRVGVKTSEQTTWDSPDWSQCLTGLRESCPSIDCLQSEILESQPQLSSQIQAFPNSFTGMRDACLRFKPKSMPPPLPPRIEHEYKHGMASKSHEYSFILSPSSNKAAADALRRKLQVMKKTYENTAQCNSSTQEAEKSPAVNSTAVSLDATGFLKEDLLLAEKDSKLECLQALRKEDRLAEVAFLGTGSAEPSKYRGPSAVHLRLPQGGLLLDAGENTFGQLVRAHGQSGAVAEVAALTAIWISHKHADHCLGVPALLAARPSSCRPLLVIGPWEIGNWLQEAVADSGFKYTFVHCGHFNNILHPLRPHVLSILELEGFHSVPVKHCRDAWGLVLKAKAGWKIVYSGDTRPCGALVRTGRGATLLIHEATFEHALQEKAAAKRHSTAEEAMQCAEKMGAFRTVLTHFSQRYPRMPEGLQLDVRPLSRRPVVAFDGMRVPLALLPELPVLMPLVASALSTEPAEEVPAPPTSPADSGSSCTEGGAEG
uniref:ribonuclease Z n=1 Tax=Tetraselmis sp. GSL018 TaxID=582737 RepID=A0A061RVH9_9CHLO